MARMPQIFPSLNLLFRHRARPDVAKERENYRIRGYIVHFVDSPYLPFSLKFSPPPQNRLIYR